MDSQAAPPSAKPEHGSSHDAPVSSIGPSAVSSGASGPSGSAMLAKWKTMTLARRAPGWELGLPAFAHPALKQSRRPLPIIIAVGGGKGGVGKSLISANLAIRLGLAGHRVLAVDLDVGGANLHTYFGLTPPQVNLADVIIYGTQTLGSVAQDTIAPGVQLVSCGREEIWGGTNSIDRSALARFSHALFQTGGDVDVVILDLGAGTAAHTLELFSIANLGLVTVLPEPTSIENAYLFLKKSLFQLVQNVGTSTGVPETADAVEGHLIGSEETGGPAASVSYVDKLRSIESAYPGFVRQVQVAQSSRALGFIMNQVRSQRDIDIGRSMEVIAQRFFGYETRYSGFLNYDDAAWKSLRNRRLLLADFPHSILARRFTELSRQVLVNLGY